uniref:Coiled-coil domain containing 84 n=1 Tax=Oryzias latipes TaxID=8090 RepID=A0A3P9I985_ORYLA
MGTHYCNICRQTTFSGKKHIFGKQHQSSLRVVLTKFIEKVKEARRTIKKPQVEKFDCIQHKQTFWCYCCEAEVEKNVTDDKMTVLFGGLLEHMATKEHKKKTHKFWWDNKADQKLKDKVLITEEDMKRFKDEVANVLETFVEEEDDFIKQQAAVIRAQEKHRQEVFESLLEVCFPAMQWHAMKNRTCLMEPAAPAPLLGALGALSFHIQDCRVQSGAASVTRWLRCHGRRPNEA